MDDGRTDAGSWPSYKLTLWAFGSGELKIWTPGVDLPPPQGNVHIYYNNIQRSFSLKALGHSKPNFIGSIYMKGESMYIFINNPGHMIKMAAMPIYGKNPSKFFFSLTTGPISTKLGVKHRGIKYYNVFINYDLWMTLTYFTARST